MRVFDALQTAEKNACATPANWKPGDAVIVPAPITQQDAEKRVATEGMEAADGPPELFRDVVARDVVKWTKVVKAANIKQVQ